MGSGAGERNGEEMDLIDLMDKMDMSLIVINNGPDGEIAQTNYFTCMLWRDGKYYLSLCGSVFRLLMPASTPLDKLAQVTQAVITRGEWMQVAFTASGCTDAVEIWMPETKLGITLTTECVDALPIRERFDTELILYWRGADAPTGQTLALGREIATEQPMQIARVPARYQIRKDLPWAEGGLEAKGK